MASGKAALSMAAPPVVALVDSEARMGGVEFSTLYLVEQIDRTRFQPLVICPADGDLPARCRQAGVRTLIMPRSRTFSTSIRLGGRHGRYVPNPLAWAVNAATFLVAARRLAKTLRKKRVDLVCTKGMQAHFYGGLAARLAGVPCVWHVQDLVSVRAGKLYPAILGWSGRMLARRIILDGGTIQEQLQPYVPAERLTVIHNGVDTALFSPEVDGTKVRREWGIEPDELLIGNVARLTRWKGQHELVHAFSMLKSDFPQARLVLVGSPVFDSDAYEQELKELTRRSGIEERVIFAGYRWDLPQVLAALDIFVHSSIEKDTSPLAVVSAMSAGKAIVSTNVGGVAELFDEGEALLVRPSDAEGMASSLRILLSNPQLRSKMGQAARCKAERSLSLSQFARRCEDIFEKALASPLRP
jgi:glycosyltransferase involved in cell wall biosynthesis